MRNINYNKFQKIIFFLLKYGTIIISIIIGIIGFLSIFITAYFNSTFYHPEEKTSFKYIFGCVEILITIFVVTRFNVFLVFVFMLLLFCSIFRLFW